MSRVLATAVDPLGLHYERNEAQHRRLVGELRERLEKRAPLAANVDVARTVREERERS